MIRGMIGITGANGLEIYVNPLQVSHVMDCAPDNPGAQRNSILVMRNGSTIPIPLKAYQVARKIGIERAAPREV